jgi:hypothetical protein
MASQAITLAPPPAITDANSVRPAIGLGQVPTEGGQPSPQSLQDCLPNLLISSPAQIKAPEDEREGRGGGSGELPRPPGI